MNLRLAPICTKNLCLISAILVIGFCAECSSAQTTIPAGDETEYDLHPMIKTGTIPVSWKSTSTMKGAMSYGAVPEYFDLAIAADIALSVDKALPEGKSPGKLLIKRLSGSARKGRDSATFDTSLPQTVVDEAGKPSYLTYLCRQDFPLNLDKSLKPLPLEIPQAVADGCAQAFADQADAAACTQAVTQWVQVLAAEPYAYLPIAAVKVGQSWQARKRVAYIDHFGLPVIVEEISDCILLKVASNAGTRMAQVEIVGKCTLPGRDTEKELAQYDVTGAMRVNIDDPRRLRWRTQLVGRLKDKDNKDTFSHTITTEITAAQEAPAATQSTKPSSK